MNKAVARIVASVAFMGVAGFGVSACGSQPDPGYAYVWDHGSYTYVPYGYYTSHRSYYDHTGHSVRRVSKTYVTKHHVTVVHKTVVHKSTTVKKSSKGSTHHKTTVHKYRSTKRR